MRIILLLPFFWPLLVAAQQPLPVDPLIRSGTLDNGLRYFIRPNDEPANRVELRLIVRAGALQEADDQRGLAHFVEHMAFNGTTHFAKNELIDFLESTGMRFGPDLNAYTSFEETVYRLQVRSDSAAYLEKGLLILEDWASGIRFTPAEVEKERGVVISEWRSRLSPEQRQQQQIFPVLYQDSRYAERLPIGDPAIIESAPVATLRRFYEDWYRPDLMTLVVVGDIDPVAIEREITRRFADLNSPIDPPGRVTYTVPDYDTLRYVQATDLEAAFTEVKLYLPQPAAEGKDSLRNEITTLLVNRMLGARLYELQQQPNPPFTFATSALTGSLDRRQAYLVSAFSSPEQIEDGFRTVLQATLQARQHGFLASELDRKKQELRTRLEKAAREESSVKSGTYANRIVQHVLNDAPLLTNRQRYHLYDSLLQTITLEEINAQLPSWWDAGGRTIVVTAPAAATAQLPGRDAWAQLIKTAEKQTYPSYTEMRITEPLFDQELPAVSWQRTYYDSTLGIEEYQFANGVRLILKATNFKEGEILLSAFSPGGHSVYPDSLYQAASIAANIVASSGVGPYDESTLTKFLSDKNVSVGPYITELYEGFGGQTTPEELELMLQLIYLYATEPRRSEDALQSYQARQVPVLENLFANPYYSFGDFSFRVRYGDHPRRGIPRPEEVAALRMDDIWRIYQDRFRDAGDFTFVLVGNIDPQQDLPLLARYLGNLPVTSRRESWQNTGARLVPGVIDTTLVAGQASKVLVEINFHGDMVYSAAERFAYNSLLEVARIRLRERLREDLGGVYGVRVNGTALAYPTPNFRTAIRFDAQPVQLDTLLTTLYEEIRLLQEEDVDDTYVQKIQETYRQERRKNQRENRYWLGQLTTRYRNHIPLDGMKDVVFNSYVAGLTPKSIREAAHRYFDWRSRVQLVLMPEGGKERRRD